MTEPIRILLADDHPLVRRGISITLSAEQDMIVIGEAATNTETQRLSSELKPDIVLLDVSMPGPRAVETVAYLHQHCAPIKILVLTAYDDAAYVRGLVAADVGGYILKEEPPEIVVHAVRAVMRGGTWFSPAVVEKLVHGGTTDPFPYEDIKLTSRERSILLMIAQGWENPRIAAQLDLAEQTVRNYVSRLYNKLGVLSRAEAIVWAHEHQIERSS